MHHVAYLPKSRIQLAIVSVGTNLSIRGPTPIKNYFTIARYYSHEQRKKIQNYLNSKFFGNTCHYVFIGVVRRFGCVPWS